MPLTRSWQCYLCGSIFRDDEGHICPAVPRAGLMAELQAARAVVAVARHLTPALQHLIEAYDAAVKDSEGF